MKIANSRIALNLKDSGEIGVLLDRAHFWQGTGPLMILHYYDRQHPRKQTVALPSDTGFAFGTAGTPSLGARGELRVESRSNGLEVIGEFPSIGIRMAVDIALLDAGFSVRLNSDAIEERLPDLYRVLAVEILPQFGAARTGEPGYLTLPNWSGCQTFYNKTYPREVRQTIYSSNDQWENVCDMPVFGITRNHGTLCGLVAAGDYDAELICRLHWENDQANSVHPNLIYRWEQQDALLPGRREVRYFFTSPNDASGEGYVACGRAYREFLRSERGLQTWAEKETERPVVADYRDRFFLKIFMAYKDPQADGRGRYHATCTFDEVKQILEECLAMGMSRLAVMLVGWGRDGHDGMPPTRFPVDLHLGGEEGFRMVLEWCRDRDIMLGVHDSYGEGYACSPEFDLGDVIRHRTGEAWQGIIWSGGQVHKICPSVFVEKHTRRDISHLSALGVYGHHHIDAIGSFMTCHSHTHPLELRQDFTRQVSKMFRIARETMGSVSTEMPFGPYFADVDGFFHSYTDPSPWHRASPMGRFFLDRTVPLLQTAVHGSINCGESVGEHDDDPLYWLDLGLTPVWEVCAHPSESFGIPAFSSVAQTMLRIYNLYFGNDGLAVLLGQREILSRSEPAKLVSCTQYSGGIEVWVNRSKMPYNGISPGEFHVIRSKFIEDLR
ncbi:MAG: hypothetical protein BGO12_03795 [Verrucomicrobia bacterium 61-8]|nr:hypothetical protein [Verrucomicrobiota bacterium]OJV23827.1 MAG: hypothetical protein BGO12_03795 [Verrucomicrobia bacterium 61-8]